jgi:hypothetical protein
MAVPAASGAAAAAAPRPIAPAAAIRVPIGAMRFRHARRRYGRRVVLADDDSTVALYLQRHFPWLCYVIYRHSL